MPALKGEEIMKMKAQHLYEFTLVLDTVSDQTLGLEDQLFEAGCDDALINFRNGTVYLDFSREACSIEEAVISAINSVESSQLEAKVVRVLPDELVTEAEIAKRLQEHRQTVSLWVKGERRRKIPFPNPVSRLSDKSPMWRWVEVVEWLREQHKADKISLDSARFIEVMNAVLLERDPSIQSERKKVLTLLKKTNRVHR